MSTLREDKMATMLQYYLIGMVENFPCLFILSKRSQRRRIAYKRGGVIGITPQYLLAQMSNVSDLARRICFPQKLLCIGIDGHFFMTDSSIESRPSLA